MSDLNLIIANRNYSSWSLRAWLALEATGQPYEEVVIPLGRPETTEEILAQSNVGLRSASRSVLTMSICLMRRQRMSRRPSSW